MKSLKKKKKNISKHYKISLTCRLPSYSAVWGGTGLITVLPFLVAAQQLLKKQMGKGETPSSSCQN